MLERSRTNPQQLSTREQREYKRQLSQTLKDYQIESSRKIADLLVDISIYENLEFILPLLQHPEQEWILTLAYNLARLQRNNQTMIMAIERASKVVFALKNYARHDYSGKKQSVLITEGIDPVLELYHNQLKRGIEVTRIYKINHPFECYPDELMQVWTNLIHNSIQAMNGKGTLKISVEEKETEFMIKITDSGCGMPSEIQTRIFEPFFTTKPPGEGSGLGLDIVKKIISKHQGEIAVESQPGTTDIQAHSIENIDLSHEIYPKQIIGLVPHQPAYKILIVDDKFSNRKLLFQLLQPLGFQLKEATNGTEAVDIFPGWKPDLIFMDMIMPIMSGSEATQQIKTGISYF